jgi:hypothetical protein
MAEQQMDHARIVAMADAGRTKDFKTCIEMILWRAIKTATLGPGNGGMRPKSVGEGPG